MASSSDNPSRLARLEALALTWHSEPQKDTREAILTALEPLITQQARKCANQSGGGIELDDALQIGRIAVIAALATWKPEMGTFWTWVNHAIRNRLRPRRSARQTVALDQVTEVAFPTPELGCELTMELENALATLPERERLVIRLNVIEQIDLVEIGRRIGLSGERVRQIKRQGLVKLRRKLSWLQTDF